MAYIESNEWRMEKRRKKWKENFFNKKISHKKSLTKKIFKSQENDLTMKVLHCFKHFFVVDLSF
jgi:hypothetical protein